MRIKSFFKHPKVFSFKYFNVEDVKREINNINSKKATPKGDPVKILKWNSHIIVPALRSQSTFSSKIKNTLKNIKVPLYTHFYKISLNVLRPTFFNICNLPFSHFPNIRKIRIKVGPQTNYFSYFMSPCTDRIIVFNNFFSLIFTRPRDKQNRARDFLFCK